ncbi:MAG: NlpC/P60 family protein [Bacteroidota bacterium]|nr:NlpC/P60 family protein [Bacteroidota bacterium]
MFVVLLTSCAQLKSLSSRDSSTSTKPSQKSSAKKVKFLDNISVTPGQVVISKHAMGPAMPPVEKRKKQRESYNQYAARPVSNSGDIERADWLQLKYAILLDATVETLTNVNLLKLIDEWYGTNYCMGGNTKDCIDCSAFTHIIMQEVYNVNVPRTAQEQFKSSQHINLEDLEEGDLVFFNTNGGSDMSHVGVYMLNNKFVHAATSGGVMVSDLNDSYWKPRFRGAGRYIMPTASVGR